MAVINGYIDHIIYHNQENGYSVFILTQKQKEVTCVGTFSSISEGENIEATGEYIEHPTYGSQFKIESYEEKEPEDEISIIRYLGSGAIKGIGASLAARIVNRFKEDTFRIIEEEPERLSEVKGISERKAMEIAEQVTEKKDLRRAMIFLQQYGISLNLAAKIYQQYGIQIYNIMKENPYRLADDIQGIGFHIADEIAAKVGIRTDSDFRLRSGVLYTLLRSVSDGHTFLPKEELMQKAAKLLDVEAQLLEKHIVDLAMERRIIIKEDNQMLCVYSSAFYYMELNSAVLLQKLDIGYDIPDIEMEARISSIEKQTSMELDERQFDAIKEAVQNGLFVLTGGPGTGKTTTINAIIKYFELEGLDIFLAAPTGRAAKRMSEMTGYEAKTIHRMLELTGAPNNAASFERNENNPLETDVIIIDEMSMVDISLMHSLLKAILPGTRLILVGDVNQLPSVGAGNVLKDIIESNMFHMVRLTRIFRQASQSDIIVNAHKINEGQEVSLDNKSKDFFFLKRYDADVIISILIQLIQQKLPKYVKATTFDIQVLTPMRKGLLGVERLNKILQEYINPASKEKEEYQYKEGLFREGDKIMQIKNNYQIPWEVRSKYGFAVDKGLGIFNGDMGVIKKINSYTEMMLIEFDDERVVEYPFKLLEELDLAYAVTIHKSQGSEYPAVVIPLLSGPRMLMNRNLLYTAVTRARKCVTLVGDEHAFYSMIHNTMEQKRYSGLKHRLLEDASSLKVGEEQTN